MWDAHWSLNTSQAGMIGAINLMNTQWSSGGYYRDTLFRHGVARNKGPNSLFVDGHVEPRIAFFSVLDTEISIPW